MIFKDQLHRTLNLPSSPKRIISLVPSQTELLVYLGLEGMLVGITKFCVHPEHLRKKITIVGGTKDVKFKKIKDLRPDIVICNKEENTQEIVKTLEKDHVVYVSDILSINDNLSFIKDLGQIFKVETKAQQLIKIINLELNEFKLFIKEKPQRKVAYFIWRNPWMVAGKNTFINKLITLNHFTNVFDCLDRYPEITLQQLETKNLDLILLSSEPYPFKEKHIKEIQQFTSAEILFVDGEYFSWYGSRLLKAFKYFKSLHH